MLNKSKLAIAGAIIAAGMASTGANAATQTATAKVEILAPVVLSPVTTLDLGVVAVGATGGTVALPNTSNTRTCSATLTCVGTAARGSFQVTSATNGYVIAITVPASTSLTGVGSPMAMTLSPSATSITFNSASLQTIYVGGTLTVGNNQAAGTYTGTYNVSADYQ
jgi:Mat/Ecp fimbriae major subunit